MPAINRYKIMMNAADLIDKRLDTIARVLTMENGKPLGEAKGEVPFSAETARWYAEEGRRAYGRIVPGRVPGQRQMVYKEPVGVVVAFAAGMAAKAAALKLGDGLDADTQMGPMIAPRPCDAIQSLVDDAVAKGAKLLAGGHCINRAGNFYAPTVLADVPEDARTMSEKPFDSVASIVSFSTFEEVIARANALPYGLASFVFTEVGATAREAEMALEAGLVSVNHTMISTPETPFGGVNESSFGSESGIEGREAFQRTKFVSELF